MAGTHSAGTKSEANAIYVAELDRTSGSSSSRPGPTVAYASGHLLYVRDRTPPGAALRPGSSRAPGRAASHRGGDQLRPRLFPGHVRCFRQRRPGLPGGGAGAQHAARLARSEREGAREDRRIPETTTTSLFRRRQAGHLLPHRSRHRGDRTLDPGPGKECPDPLHLQHCQRVLPGLVPRRDPIAYVVSGKYDDIFRESPRAEARKRPSTAPRKTRK